MANGRAKTAALIPIMRNPSIPNRHPRSNLKFFLELAISLTITKHRPVVMSQRSLVLHGGKKVDRLWAGAQEEWSIKINQNNLLSYQPRVV